MVLSAGTDPTPGPSPKRGGESAWAPLPLKGRGVGGLGPSSGCFNSFAARSSNILEHASKFLHDLLVAESQDGQTAIYKMICPRLIVLFLNFVHWTVHLHHQPSLVTIEIYNQTVNNLLATKMESI